MPLLVADHRLESTPRDINVFVDTHTALKEASLKLRDTPPRVIGPKGLLYVCQKEYAIVPVSAGNIQVLGADDATTCHILVMKHSGCGVACIAHLDGTKTLACVLRMFSKLKKLCVGAPDGRFEAHLVGGFLDDRHISINLSLEILGALMNIPDEIHLLTACVTDWNDTVRGALHFPVIYGLAYELKTGLLYPATFSDKGPAVDLRSASHFSEDCEPADVFDNDQLVIGPFDWNFPLHLVKRFLANSDEYFLQNWSTSPDQEPDHFVQHLRDALYVLRDHPRPSRTLFKDGKPHLYHKNSNGLWFRLS